MNAVFVFGLLGIPKFGAAGIATATVIARLVEMLICIMHMIRLRIIKLRIPVPPQLTKDFAHICLPFMTQGLVWGGAMAAFSAIMGRMGSDAVAANSVASTVQHVALVACNGLGEAGSILLGNELGNRRFEDAKKHSRLLLRVSVAFGVIGCVVMLLVEQPLSSVLNLTPLGIQYFSAMYKMLSINVIFVAITNTLLSGIFPAGGDTRFGLVTDGAVMWGVCVLLGCLSAFVFKMSPLFVFIVLNIDELVKTPIVLIRYKKDKWINDITRREEIGQ